MWFRPGELCALGPCGGLFSSAIAGDGQGRLGSQLYLMLLRLAFETKGSTVYQQVVKNFWGAVSYAICRAPQPGPPHHTKDRHVER